METSRGVSSLECRKIALWLEHVFKHAGHFARKKVVSLKSRATCGVYSSMPSDLLLKSDVGCFRDNGSASMLLSDDVFYHETGDNVWYWCTSVYSALYLQLLYQDLAGGAKHPKPVTVPRHGPCRSKAGNGR